jgi:exosortase/archaeosortase family protein
LKGKDPESTCLDGSDHASSENACSYKEDGKLVRGPGESTRRKIGLGIRFAIFLGALYFVFTFGPVYERVVSPFTAFTARLAATTGKLLHMSVDIRGATLLGPRSSVNVGQGCDAIDVVSIILAAGLATPATFTRKFSFIVFGIAAILVLNIARLLSLLYTAALSGTFMEILHIYVWPVILLFACLGLWYYWFEARGTA